MLREQGIKIIIENVVGATGTIGMRRVALAPPDGYTIGMGTSSTLALIAQGKTPLKNEQFTNIARVSTDPLMLLVSSGSQHKTLEDFLGYMKKNPDKVSIGTPGSYNLNHIFALMTARAAGVGYVNVPYSGGSKVVADLLGQHADAGVLKPSETIGQVQENLLRPIGVFANQRLDMFPDVPTFKERGIDVFPYGPVVQMAYVVAPANIPADVRTKLISAFKAAIQDPRFEEFASQERFPCGRSDGRRSDKRNHRRLIGTRHGGRSGFPERIISVCPTVHDLGHHAVANRQIVVSQRKGE